MLRILALGVLLMAGSVPRVFAHHGWGSYDASKPVIVDRARSRRLKYENPHATHHRQSGRQGVDGDPGADLAHAEPRRAGRVRGGRQDRWRPTAIASSVEKGEMRAERITVDGKIVEMR